MTIITSANTKERITMAIYHLYKIIDAAVYYLSFTTVSLNLGGRFMKDIMREAAQKGLK